MAADKTLTCRECSQSFLFAVREQEFFADRGFPDPVRCLPCRRALKARRAGETPPPPSPSLPPLPGPAPLAEEFPELRPAYRAERGQRDDPGREAPEPVPAGLAPGRSRYDDDERPRRSRRRPAPPAEDDE